MIAVMTMRCIIVGVSILALLGTVVLSPQVADASPRKGFKLFDAMLFSGAPNFAKYGFQHLRIVDDHELYGPADNTDNVPSTGQIAKILSGGTGPAGIIAIDLEHWSMTGGKNLVAASRQKYVETLIRFHKASPKGKFGLYDVLPGRDYWRAMGPRGGAVYESWQREVDEAQPVVAHVDALFPSLYTFYSDQAGWVRYATENLRQARRIAAGKPIYCFLWPQYHDSAATPFALLPGDYWQLELETCRKLADGVVIWGGYNTRGGFTPLAWDETAPWWKATLRFTRSLDR